jgi:hypothetical protein
VLYLTEAGTAVDGKFRSKWVKRFLKRLIRDAQDLDTTQDHRESISALLEICLKEKWTSKEASWNLVFSLLMLLAGLMGYQGMSGRRTYLIESEEVIREASNLLKRVKKQLKQNFLGRADVIEQAKHDLLPLVYRYYQIDELEQILINDTVNCWIPSSTPTRSSLSIPTLKQSTPSDRMDYLTLLCNLLNAWSRRGRYQVSGRILVSSKSGMGIVVLQKVASQGLSSSVEEESSSQLDEALTRVMQLLPRYEGSIAYYRNLKVFDRDKLYILKPLTFRFWSKTFALNDADEIAAEILTNNHRNV